MLDRFVLVLLACAVATSLVSLPASAWSNGGYSADQSNPDYGTHDWIADAALSFQTKDVTFLRTTYHSSFMLGTEAPDNPSFIGDTSKHHVYFRANGQVQDDASALRASALYDVALGYLNSGDLSAAAYDIGAMAHYVSDPGVFGHTMGASTDWGSEVHHSDYEDHFESILGTLQQLLGTAGNETAYSATLDLGETVTFGSGDIRPNTWMDTNYDWANAQFSKSARASLNNSAVAVASVINHLMIEATSVSPNPSPPATRPSPPEDLSAESGEKGVVLTWSPPSSDGGTSLTNYIVYRSNSSGVPMKIATVLPPLTTWTDTSTLKGETYRYWVAAQNSAGISDLSLPASITIPTPRTNSLVVPAVISAVVVSLASGLALVLRSRRRRS